MKKVAAPGLENRLTAVGTRCADHVTPLYPQKLALTSPTGGGRSVGIVRVRTKATEFSLVCVYTKTVDVSVCSVTFVFSLAIVHAQFALKTFQRSVKPSIYNQLHRDVLYLAATCSNLPVFQSLPARIIL